MRTGLNINCLEGNRVIPDGYVLNPETEWDLVAAALRSVLRHVRPTRIRTILWPTERDQVRTKWLHIPMTEPEVSRTQAFARECASFAIPVELVIGPLWEARWLDTTDYPFTGPIPDNPFTSPQELFEALRSSLWRLLYTGPGLPKGTIIDLWNEFDVLDTQEPVVTLWHPWARDAVKQAGLLSSVSTIVPPDGSPRRALDSYRWIDQLAAGMPDILEVHVNGVADAALQRTSKTIARELRQAYPQCRITVGEDDVPRTTPSASATWIADLAPEEYLEWVDTPPQGS